MSTRIRQAAKGIKKAIHKYTGAVTMGKKGVNVGIIGFGTVGTGTARILMKMQVSFPSGPDFPVVLKKIADRDITRDRGLSVPAGILTTSADDLLNDPDIDIVVELVGGIHRQRTLSSRRLPMASMW